MKKNDLLLLLIILSVALTSLGALYLYKEAAQHAKTLTAVVKVDNKVLKRVNLTTLKTTYTEKFTTANGGYNIVEFSPNHVRIIESNCPDKICIKHGYVLPNSAPAACLPHHLLVEVEGSADSNIDEIVQ